MGPSLRVRDCRLHYIPISMSLPLSFGRASLRDLECLRVRMTVEDSSGRTYDGWGEVPLNIAWAWPEAPRDAWTRQAVRSFCSRIAQRWCALDLRGHALELGHRFLTGELTALASEARTTFHIGAFPRRMALLCAAPFDIALHDAYGRAAGLPTYETYGPEHLTRDLSSYFGPEARRFVGRYPADYLLFRRPERIAAWHLVGCSDAVEAPADEPAPGDRPRSVVQWIARDGVTRLKIKVCAEDRESDVRRLLRVGAVAEKYGVQELSVDFNGTAPSESYVTTLLERLAVEAPTVYDRLRFVEQPFAPGSAVEAEGVRAVSELKPVYVDEGAGCWQEVRAAWQAGYAGVALKTCKTQTAAVLSACWAREYGMGVIVQDLTNPMLAQVAHVLLAAHVAPEMGVESNSMQFCPEASEPEARVHPGLYRRTGGMLDLSTVGGPGFGYRVEEIRRELPEDAA
ncbi:MAG: enolase C-terminal domain-like protein [Spirochaetaceae bacterium]